MQHHAMLHYIASVIYPKEVSMIRCTACKSSYVFCTRRPQLRLRTEPSGRTLRFMQSHWRCEDCGNYFAVEASTVEVGLVEAWGIQHE